MIKNEKQYQITNSKLIEFKKALKQIEQVDTDPLLNLLQTNALKSQIEEFENLITEYEELRAGKVAFISIHSIPEISNALIAGRIAKGWSQSTLAEKVGMKEQQVQRYEAQNYTTASIPKIALIAEALGLVIQTIRIGVNNPVFSTPSGINSSSVEIAKIKMRNNKSLFA